MEVAKGPVGVSRCGQSVHMDLGSGEGRNDWGECVRERVLSCMFCRNLGRTEIGLTALLYVLVYVFHCLFYAC